MIKMLKSLIAPFYSSVHTCPSIAMEPSYYPDRLRKSLLRRYFEIVYQRFVTRSTNLFYNAYGMDIKGFRKPKDYVWEREFWTKIISQNYQDQKINHSVVLRDKLLFWSVMMTHGIRTPEVVAHSMRGHYFLRGKEVCFSEWEKSWTAILGNVFVKNNTSCCGRGIYKVKVGHGNAECNDKNFSLSEAFFRDGDFIVQKEVRNHELLARIYPKSLNTARFITVWSEEKQKPELFAQFFRIGANDNVVDNWAVGGLLFTLDSDGNIGNVGFFKDKKYAHGHGMRVKRHPDTGVSFEGMRVPDYEAGLELALKAHTVLPTVKSIGWDVAFTDDGPLIVEGNDDWEIAPCQILTGGLRVKAHDYFGVRNV